MKQIFIVLIIAGLSLGVQACSHQTTAQYHEIFSKAVKGDSAALQRLTDMANSGKAGAQYMMGILYFYGWSVPKDHRMAVSMFQKAADQDNSDAEGALGVCYLYSAGVPHDAVIAVSWLEKAAGHGSRDAEFILGQIYTGGYIGISADFPKAVSWFQKAVDHGNTEADLDLGVIYYEGDGGVPKDYAKAASLLQVAASHPNLREDYGKHSPLLFMQMSLASSLRNLYTAQEDLGNIYESGGYGVQQDYSKSSAVYNQAADQGDTDAQQKLSTDPNLHIDVTGLKQTTDAQIKALGDKAEIGDASALWQLKNIANAGNVHAQESLGYIYQVGNYRTPEDIATSFSWYSKAADQGDTFAQVNVGVDYFTGHGVQQDYTQAVAWLTKAADQGDANAQLYMGIAYFTGHGVQQDYIQAVAWLTKAAEQGNAAAEHNLAYAFYNGKGVAKDPAKAKYWQDKSTAQSGSATNGP